MQQPTSGVFTPVRILQMVLLQVVIAVVIAAVAVPYLRDRGDRDGGPRFDPAGPAGVGAGQELIAPAGLRDVAFGPGGDRLGAVSDGKTMTWQANPFQMAAVGSQEPYWGGTSLTYWQGNTLLRAIGGVDGQVLINGQGEPLYAGDPFRRDGFQAALPGRHPNQVTDLDFSHDGRLLVSTSFDTLMVWNTATRTPVGALVEFWKLAPSTRDGLGITGVVFHPDNRTVAVASGDQVTLWDIPSRKVTGVAPAGGRALSVAISPDGLTMAIGRDGGSVQLWSFRDRRNVRQPLLGLDSYVYRLAFSAKGDFLVGGSQHATVIWEPETGKLLTPALPGGSGFALSPDDKMLAMFDYNNPIVRLYPTGVR
jgi:WD40 repeat protein